MEVIKPKPKTCQCDICTRKLCATCGRLIGITKQRGRYCRDCNPGGKKKPPFLWIGSITDPK